MKQYPAPPVSLGDAVAEVSTHGNEHFVAIFKSPKVTYVHDVSYKTLKAAKAAAEAVNTSGHFYKDRDWTPFVPNTDERSNPDLPGYRAFSAEFIAASAVRSAAEAMKRLEDEALVEA